MKEEIKVAANSPKRYDTGTSEILFGLMSLAFALIYSGFGKSSQEDGVANFMFICGLLIGVWFFAFWLCRAIQKHIVWPRTGYVVLRPEKYWRSGTLVIAFVTVVVATALACLVILARPHGSPGNPGTDIVHGNSGRGALTVCGMAVLFACAASYAYWFFLIGRREHPWKWLILLAMVIGLVAIGLLVHGELLKVLAPAALLSGVVWLVSGTATLLSYVRHNKPLDREAA
jgi:hypothetical protein